VDRQDGVPRVVLAGEHDLQLALVERLLERLDRLPEVGADVLALPGQLGAHLGVLQALLELAERLDFGAETGACLEGRLGAGGVVPEVRVGDLLLYLGKLAGARLEIKDAPEAP
jgi:hypothetical protein